MKNLPLYLFLAYLFSLPLSIAGMEIFFALHVILTVVLLITKRIGLTNLSQQGIAFLFWGSIGLGTTYWFLILLSLSKYADQLSVSEILFLSRDAKFFFVFSWVLLWAVQFGEKFRKVCFRVFPVLVGCVAIYGVLQAIFPLDILAPLRELHKPVVIYRYFGEHATLATIGAYSFHLTYANAYILYFVLLSLATVQMCREKDPAYKLSFLLVGVVATSLVTTFSRNVWVSLCFLTMSIGLRYAKRRVVPVLIVCAVLGGAFVSMHPLARDFVRRAFDPTTDYQGLGQRIRNWNVQWAMFLEHPLLGMGHQQNEKYYEQYRQKYFSDLDPTIHVGGHAHNTFLQILVADGLVGLVIWLIFFIWVASVFIKYRHISPWYGARSGLWLLGAFFISGLTENALGDAEVAHNLFTMLGLAVAYTTSGGSVLITRDSFSK